MGGPGMMPGMAPKGGWQKMSAEEIMSGRKDDPFRPPEPPMEPLQPDMQEISKEVFGDKVDDIMNLMAQAAGTRQGLKLVQNVLGGIVPRGGKDLQRILSKDADKIADAIENDPRMFEMLMHKLGETKAGQQLQELLKKSPEGKELFDEVEARLEEALAEYNDEVAAYEEEFAQYEEQFQDWQDNMQSGNFGGPQGGFDQGGFGGPQQHGQPAAFGGPQGGDAAMQSTAPAPDAVAATPAPEAPAPEAPAPDAPPAQN